MRALTVYNRVHPWPANADETETTAAAVAGAQGGASEQGRPGDPGLIVAPAAIGTVPGTSDKGDYEGSGLPPEEMDLAEADSSTDPRTR